MEAYREWPELGDAHWKLEQVSGRLQRCITHIQTTGASWMLQELDEALCLVNKKNYRTAELVLTWTLCLLPPLWLVMADRLYKARHVEKQQRVADLGLLDELPCDVLDCIADLVCRGP
jgi:hypothetical protein